MGKLKAYENQAKAPKRGSVGIAEDTSNNRKTPSSVDSHKAYAKQEKAPSGFTSSSLTYTKGNSLLGFISDCPEKGKAYNKQAKWDNSQVTASLPVKTELKEYSYQKHFMTKEYLSQGHNDVSKGDISDFSTTTDLSLADTNNYKGLFQKSSKSQRQKVQDSFNSAFNKTKKDTSGDY